MASDAADQVPGSKTGLTGRGLTSLKEAIAASLATPLVVAAAVVSAVLFFVGGMVIGFPTDGGSDTLLLHQAVGPAMLVLAIVLLVVGTAAGTMLAGRVRYDAGWAAALVGLLVLRHVGESIYYTLDDAGTGVFVTMLVELLVLSAVTTGLWSLLHLGREKGAMSPALRRWLELPGAKTRTADRATKGDSWQTGLAHLGTATGVCGLVVYFVAQNDDPMQTTVAVGLGGWLGALAAHANVPARPAYWSFAAPLIVGVVGYVAAMLFTDPVRLALGEPGGPLKALAMPLPAEYLGAGIPMAMYGYVRARTKQAEAVAGVAGAVAVDTAIEAAASSSS
ncbi:MAG: hypothetical protein AAGI46_03500 [Planctomycetota bacterium]